MTKIILIRGDITRLKVEAIVNAANESGLGCNIPNHCIDSAIHSAAGPQLLEECKKLGGIPTGTAKITHAYNLPSQYIIHVTGPRHLKGHKFDYKMLSQCYYSCMNLAAQYNITEIAFCCISTGLFGYPKKESAIIAIGTIKKWCRENLNYRFDKIIFNVFTDEDEIIYKELFIHSPIQLTHKHLITPSLI